MMDDPQKGGQITRAGATAAHARLAVLLLHGRGGSAKQMIALAKGLAVPEVAFFAPQAAGQTWWPVSFLAPFSELEPWLSSALRAVDRTFLAMREEGFEDQRSS